MNDVLFTWKGRAREGHEAESPSHAVRLRLYATGAVTVERPMLFWWRSFAVGQWTKQRLKLTRVKDGASLDETFWHTRIHNAIRNQLAATREAYAKLVEAERRELSKMQDRHALLDRLWREE